MVMIYANLYYSVRDCVLSYCPQCGCRFNVASGHGCIKPKKPKKVKR